MQRCFVNSGTLVSLLILSLVIGCGKGGKQETAAQTEPQTAVQAHASIMDHQKMADEGMIHVGPLSGKLPQGWTNVPPSSSMRRAEYHLAPAEGAPDAAMVTVFYFGADAGGVEANIKRWMDQFQKPDGSPITVEDLTRDKFTANDLEISLVKFSGTQKSSTMSSAPATGEMPGWMNVSAIVMTPQGPWFFKGTGPESTMQKNYDAFRQMLSSLKFNQMQAENG